MTAPIAIRTLLEISKPAPRSSSLATTASCADADASASAVRPTCGDWAAHHITKGGSRVNYRRRRVGGLRASPTANSCVPSSQRPVSQPMHPHPAAVQARPLPLRPLRPAVSPQAAGGSGRLLTSLATLVGAGVFGQRKRMLAAQQTFCSALVWPPPPPSRTATETSLAGCRLGTCAPSVVRSLRPVNGTLASVQVSAQGARVPASSRRFLPATQRAISGIIEARRPSSTVGATRVGSPTEGRFVMTRGSDGAEHGTLPP